MKTLTPLERLKAEQQRLEQRCREEQQMLAQEWTYLNENSGRLIRSGVIDLLFPHRRKVQAGKAQVGFIQNVLNNIPYYFTIVRENLSVIWMIVRPFYLKWKRARRKRKE